LGIIAATLDKISAKETRKKKQHNNIGRLAMKRHHKASVIAVLAVFLFVGTLAIYSASTAGAEALSKYGSRGEEVRQIQARLKKWGYYKGEVDGIYGPLTVQAVRYFQSKNGLVVDGIAGPKTLAAIGLNPNASQQSSVRQSDINLLARVISAEARGEPYTGQVAIGAVVINRMKHPSFPNTLAGVVYQPGAFTAITDGQIHASVVDSAYNAARDALNGWDPTKGCIYYYNPATATNKWIRSRPIVIRIGKHVFCK